MTRRTWALRSHADDAERLRGHASNIPCAPRYFLPHPVDWSEEKVDQDVGCLSLLERCGDLILPAVRLTAREVFTRTGQSYRDILTFSPEAIHDVVAGNPHLSKEIPSTIASTTAPSS